MLVIIIIVLTACDPTKLDSSIVEACVESETNGDFKERCDVEAVAAEYASYFNDYQNDVYANNTEVQFAIHVSEQDQVILWFGVTYKDISTDRQSKKTHRTMKSIASELRDTMEFSLEADQILTTVYFEYEDSNVLKISYRSEKDKAELEYTMNQEGELMDSFEDVLIFVDYMGVNDFTNFDLQMTCNHVIINFYANENIYELSIGNPFSQDYTFDWDKAEKLVHNYFPNLITDGGV
jgi:hypothetical protein